MMSSQGAVAAAGPRSHRLYAWFDHEAAAVVTILLGLFQVFLSVPLAYASQTLPKFFILPLVLGVLIVTAGSFSFANERNSSRLLLRGCACSNVAGLLGALLAFCLYCYGLSMVSDHAPETCLFPNLGHGFHYRRSPHDCPEAVLGAYCWSLILLLLLYDTVAVVLHCFLTASAVKALKTN